MAVIELRKPRDRWCDLCDKGVGCSAYNDRPPSCRDFECLWLQGNVGNVSIGDKLKPNLSKVVITTGKDNKGIVVHVDPGYPMAWQAQHVRDVINAFVDAGETVVIACGNRRSLVKR